MDPLKFMEHLSQQLDRVEGKIDAQGERLDDIARTQDRHHLTLEDHTRRSLANEEAVSLFKTTLEPLKMHVALTGAAAKILAAAGTAVGIVAGVAKLMGLI